MTADTKRQLAKLDESFLALTVQQMGARNPTEWDALHVRIMELLGERRTLTRPFQKMDTEVYAYA